MFHSDLTPPQLLVALGTTLTLERRTVARVIAFLVDIEETGAHKAAGYPSMRALCIKKYRMSKNEAKNRIAVARLVRRQPKVLEALESGSVTLSTVLMLKNIINDSNVDELLAMGARKTKVEVQAEIDRRDPAAASARQVRKVPAPENIDAPSRPRLQDNIEVELHIDQLKGLVSETCRAVIDEALSLSRENAKTADQLVEAAFKALVEKLREEHPTTAVANLNAMRDSGAGRDASPAHAMMATAEPPGWPCAFVTKGGRCNELGELAFSHLVPRANSELVRIDGLRPLCPTHREVEGRAAPPIAPPTPRARGGEQAPVRKGIAKANGMVVQTPTERPRSRRSANA